MMCFTSVDTRIFARWLKYEYYKCWCVMFVHSNANVRALGKMATIQ